MIDPVCIVPLMETDFQLVETVKIKAHNISHQPPILVSNWAILILPSSHSQEVEVWNENLNQDFTFLSLGSLK